MPKPKVAKVAKKPAKIVNYKVVVTDAESKVLITLATTNRAWAGSLAKLAKENAWTCVITVPATVKERVVKIAGLD